MESANEIDTVRGLGLEGDQATIHCELCALASQVHSGTYLGEALRRLEQPYNRLIVFTDEQTHDRVPAPNALGYVINVASYKNGVGYGSRTHIDGWSEAVATVQQFAITDCKFFTAGPAPRRYPVVLSWMELRKRGPHVTCVIECWVQL